MTRRDRAISWALALGYAAVLLAAQRTLGVTRDEGYYFRAAARYWPWWERLAAAPSEALTTAAIDRAFSYNHEHPALLKTLFGASERLFADVLGWMPPSWAFRLPGILLSALALSLLYRWGTRAAGPIAGLAAALAYAAMPRTAFHAQLAAFDAAVATTWLAVAYAWHRGLAEPGRWPLARAGAAFGVALAVKFTVLFLPPILALHGLLAHRARWRRALALLAAMGALGAALFWAHWPWLWTDTFDRLREYLSFHLHHSYYNMEFLGRNYNRPPLPVAYPFAMTLWTTPAITLALAAVGVPLAWRRDRAVAGLWLLNLVVPILVIAHPRTPIFGGTKHWLHAMPFLALFAGVAVARAAQACAAPAARVALAVVAAIPGALATWQTHPYGLSQYNVLAGGVPGAADLGLNRQFWGYPTRALLPWMNRTFPRGAQVYFHDTNHDSVLAYQREGLLRRDLRDAGLEEPAVRRSDRALVIHELHMAKYQHMIWNAYGTATPARVLTLDGVPLLTAYARPSPPETSGPKP